MKDENLLYQEEIVSFKNRRWIQIKKVLTISLTGLLCLLFLLISYYYDIIYLTNEENVFDAYLVFFTLLILVTMCFLLAIVTMLFVNKMDMLEISKEKIHVPIKGNIWINITDLSTVKYYYPTFSIRLTTNSIDVRSGGYSEKDFKKIISILKSKGVKIQKSNGYLI